MQSYIHIQPIRYKCSRNMQFFMLEGLYIYR